MSQNCITNKLWEMRGKMNLNTYEYNDEDIKSVFNALNDGIFITNYDGIVVWMNDTSTKQLNTPRSQLIGKHISILEKDGLFKPSVTRFVLQNNKMTTKIQTSNDYKYLATGKLIKFPNDPQQYVLVQVRDITETVKSSLKLEKSEELLKNYKKAINYAPAFKKRQQDKLIKGNSDKIKEVLDIIERIAIVDTNTLLTGETGVGKSKFAKEIHRLSDRSNKPFIKINCSAIPETLLESELFGYKKGAFTGANANGKEGLVSQAHGGTLFLDEIGELPLTLQPKILQLIQDHTYVPIGASKEEKINVRIITATNKDLINMVEEKTFRADLYYRLNVIDINIPSLKERKEDILVFVNHFTNYFNKKYNRNVILDKVILSYLEAYDWPGNIRELENVIEYLVVIAKNDNINVSHLPNKILQTKESSTNTNSHDIFEIDSLPDYLNNIEKDILSQYQEKYKSTRKAADALNISQTTYVRKLKKYNIDAHNN
jgi:TyrR family helix-turn-helix protein